MAEKLKITLVKSPIGAVPKQRATIEQILYIIEHYPKRFLCIRYPYQVAQTKK